MAQKLRRIARRDNAGYAPWGDFTRWIAAVCRHIQRRNELFRVSENEIVGGCESRVSLLLSPCSRMFPPRLRWIFLIKHFFMMEKWLNILRVGIFKDRRGHFMLFVKIYMEIFHSVW